MAILTAILNTLVVLVCLFLICLILIQRGKGGGLAGAFGGMGGSSAFGTKAGDVFTRVTVVVAGVWIVLSMILVVLYNQGGQSAWGNDAPTSAVSRERPKTTGTGTGTKADGLAVPATPPAGGTTSAAPGAPTSVPVFPETPAKK